MPDPRTVVERELQRVDVPPFTLGTFHARRDRKRRNQRVAAGVLGVSIAVAGALVAGRILDVHTERTAGPLGRNGLIVFQGNRALFVAEPDGTGSHALVRSVPAPPRECLSDSTHPCAYRGMAWSPDGRQLAFAFGEVSAGLLGDMSLYVMDAATNDVRLLARCPAGPGDPTGTCDNGNRLSWSPDGGSIAVSSGDSLYLVDASSGDLTQITGCEPCSYQGPAREPSWSPDGERIAFTGNDLIVSVAADGSARQTLVRSGDVEISGVLPRWSPDGTRLAFSGYGGVSVVNADGSGLRLLVRQAPGEGPGVPSWAPDGRRIVYLNTPGTENKYRAEIRVVDATGANDQLIYRSRCCIVDWGAPFFSPDGTMIAFRLETQEGASVFVMTADGDDVRRLPGFGDPAWQGLPR